MCGASFSASASSNSFRVSSTLPRTYSLIWPLDYFLRGTLFGCIIFSDMVCFLLSEWCVATSFYQRSANHVSFYDPFYLRNLLYLIRHIDPTLLATKKYRLVFGKKLAGIFRMAFNPDVVYLYRVGICLFENIGGDIINAVLDHPFCAGFIIAGPDVNLYVFTV